MDTNHEALVKFLSRHAKDHTLLSEALRLAGPLLAIAETCLPYSRWIPRYPLRPSRSTNASSPATVLGLALGEPVRTRPLSLSRTFALLRKKERFGDAWDALSYWVTYHLSGDSTLSSALFERYEEDLDDAVLGDLDKMETLKLLLRKLFRLSGQAYRLDDLLEDEGALEESFRRGLLDGLFYLFGFTLAGDRGKVERLAPLIALLPKTVPIGNERNRYDVWLCLVA